MNTRQLVREELDLEQRRRAFWSKLYRQFPLVSGHKELAQRLLNKHMAKMADMSEDEGMEFLGDAATKEIERRNRRDVASAEARVMSGGHGGLDHGHGTDGEHTFDADDGRFDHDPREHSLGAIIKNKRAARLKAQRSWKQSDAGDRRAERNR